MRGSKNLTYHYEEPEKAAHDVADWADLDIIVLRLKPTAGDQGGVMVELPPPEQKGVVILVSGERQVGKTTLLLQVRAAANRLRVGGFLSVARFEGGEKTGIDLMDAATGEVMPLAVAESNGTRMTRMNAD